jgi:hypothetical protein
MTAKLLFRDEHTGRDVIIELTQAGVVIGRGHDCAVHTDDPLVSRKNTKVCCKEGRWYAEDLGSSNGTFVNEMRVQSSQPLSPDDVIRCGSMSFRFVPPVEVAETTLRPAPSPLTAELAAENEQLVADKQQLERRVAELLRAQSSHRDEVQALTTIGTELRDELQALRSEHEALVERARELSDEVQARDRQLERAQEEVAQHRQSADDVRAQLATTKKTADDGWRQLTNSQAEIDKLKRVMSQQERLLEERRMGLTALEKAIQTLRAEKDSLVLAQVSLRHERDELRRQLGLEIGNGATLEMLRTDV